MRNLKLLLKSIDYEGFQGSLLCKKKKRRKDLEFILTVMNLLSVDLYKFVVSVRSFIVLADRRKFLYSSI